MPARSRRPSTARAAFRPQGAATATGSDGGGPASHHRSTPTATTRCSGQSNCGGSRRHRLESVPSSPSWPSSSSAPSASSSQTATAAASNLGPICPASALTSSTPSLARVIAASASDSAAASSRCPGSSHSPAPSRSPALARSAESAGAEESGAGAAGPESAGADGGSCRSTAAAISVTGMPAAAAMSAS